MKHLRVYAFLSVPGWSSARAKVMMLVVLGILVPVIATIVALIVFEPVPDMSATTPVIVVALLTTVVGMGVTLLVVNGLLQPVVLSADTPRTYRLDKRLGELPTTLASDAAATLTGLHETIDLLVHHDLVTGLPNRARFLQELTTLIEGGEPLAVLTLRFISYDRIAAAFGHATADTALLSLSNKVRHVTREGSLIAHLGGDTLACASKRRGDAQTIDDAIAAVIDHLQQEISLGGVSVLPDLAVGVSLFPEHGDDPEKLLDFSGAVLSSAEEQDNRVSVYVPGMRSAEREDFSIEHELRRALTSGEFVLHYQPIVDTDLGSPSGGEALIRWNHPTKGLLLPAKFIPTAESRGLITAIGEWVLVAACRQLGDWKGGTLGDMKMMINISPAQVVDPTLARRVADELSRHGLDASRLGVEMTESAVMQDEKTTLRTLSELREIGISVAIDDFGTGFSALSRLMTLPFDMLKIDREFSSKVVESRNAKAICGSVIALAHGLGIEVLAEGVEEDRQVQVVRGLGCHLFQGYFFSRPLPVAEFADFVGSASALRPFHQRAERSAATYGA